MALMEMNDYMGDIETVRLANSFGLPTLYPLALNGLSADVLNAFNPNAFVESTVVPKYVQKDPLYTPPQSVASDKSPAAPTSQVQDVVNSLTAAVAQLLPVFKGNKRPKQKVVVQKDPDYTTYAVIGGAVIVASVLAIAVGKSGSRKP